jgi:hypothetical protein
MGWFPVRDKFNNVVEGMLNWPAPADGGGKAWLGGPRFLRQRQFSSGSSNSALKVRTPAKLLAKHAMSRGWLNGVPLKKLKT